MRVALYVRVSTTDRDCGLQLAELRTYAASRGWQVAGEYVDQGWSGAKASRPALDRLLRDAQLRRFDAVATWKLDRWGRSLSDCLRTIQELSALGIRFLAVTQNLDTDQANPMARLLMHLLAAFGEYERELIRERVLAGVRVARAKGKTVGRPRRVFDRGEVLRLRQTGLSIDRIARQTGLGVGTVVRVLRADGDAVAAFQNPSADLRKAVLE